MSERAVLAGGCFWGMQDLIRRLPGIISTRCGYSGGDVPNATYRNHGTHAEALEVIYDPQKLRFSQLLDVFFQIHDPTTLNSQGPDFGTQYRSEIFYLNDQQKIIAKKIIEEENKRLSEKVVTKISLVKNYCAAEEYHQKYLEKR